MVYGSGTLSHSLLGPWVHPTLLGMPGYAGGMPGVCHTAYCPGNARPTTASALASARRPSALASLVTFWLILLIPDR